MTESERRTILFTNEDVMCNLDGRLAALEEALAGQPDRCPDAAQHHPLAPSSEEEGEA